MVIQSLAGLPPPQTTMSWCPLCLSLLKRSAYFLKASGALPLVRRLPPRLMATFMARLFVGLNVYKKLGARGGDLKGVLISSFKGGP